MPPRVERFAFREALLLVAVASFAAASTVRLNGNCEKSELVSLPDVAAITELNVTGCADLQHLENAFFIRYTSLVSLEINDCHLSTLEDYALHGLNRLSHLSLARNNISEVRSWSNEDMSTLVSLDLRRNAIRQLTVRSFERYPNLQRLNLAANQLADIEDEMFRGIPHLKYLNLGRNHLRAIEARTFHGMLRLTHLALNFNAIESIDSDAFQFNSQLRSLRLDGNRLASLDFMGTPSMLRLAQLNVSHNALSESAVAALGEFSLDYELAGLDLSFNSLGSIRNHTLHSMKSLVMLNISHNSLQHIDSDSCADLELLQFLDLSSNNLSQLPAELFRKSSLLQLINLSDNELANVTDDIFAGLPFLSVLQLARNHLHSADFIGHLAASLNQAGMQLDLSGNQYDSLELKQFQHFRRVELAGNHWNCDWLIREMMAIPPNIHFGREYSIAAEWSLSLLDVSGIDCFDAAHVRRTIVVLYPPVRQYASGATAAPGQSGSNCGDSGDTITPPPFIWPKMRMDKFDSRSVILWMLTAIAIVFAGLRVSRKLLERKQLQRQRDIKLQSLGTNNIEELERRHTMDELSVTESEDTTALVVMRNGRRV